MYRKIILNHNSLESPFGILQIEYPGSILFNLKDYYIYDASLKPKPAYFGFKRARAKI
jgi:hypothetical protein